MSIENNFGVFNNLASYYFSFVVFVCENNSPYYTMVCPSTHYIKLIYVMYGRTERDRCGKIDVPPNGCQATNALQKLSEYIALPQNCGSSKPSTCLIQASNNIFGDPCGGVPKYMELVFECRYRTNGMFCHILIECWLGGIYNSLTSRKLIHLDLIIIECYTREHGLQSS